MENSREREKLVSGIERCLMKMNLDQLKRVLWYINRIWK